MLPAVEDHPGNYDPVQHKPGAGAEIEQPRRKAALGGREEQADDLRAPRQVDRFANAEDHSKRRCVCRIDGNLWQFSTVSFARSAMAGWAKSPSVRAGSQSVSRIHWSRFF